MEIKNQTLYNKDLILSYNKYYLNSYIKKNFVVITAISFVFIIYMLIKQEWIYALLLFGILLFYLVLTYFMQKITTVRLLKKSPLVEEPVLQTYIFRDDSFEIKNKDSYTVPYSNIIKAKKSTTFYMLQSNERKSYLISFEGFENDGYKEQFEKFVFSKFNLKKKRK